MNDQRRFSQLSDEERIDVWRRRDEAIGRHVKALRELHEFEYRMEQKYGWRGKEYWSETDRRQHQFLENEAIFRAERANEISDYINRY